MNEYLCPKCGKQMEEQPKFRGLWQCPDYRTALNDKPPFVYKCNGINLTDAAAEALHEELMRLYLKDFIQRN